MIVITIIIISKTFLLSLHDLIEDLPLGQLRHLSLFIGHSNKKHMVAGSIYVEGDRVVNILVILDHLRLPPDWHCFSLQ